MIKKIIKEIIKEELTGKCSVEADNESIDKTFCGKKVMIRTYSAGVHFGTLVAKEGQTAILENTRRVYSWERAATLSQLAIEGSKNIDDCKIAMTIPSIQLDGVIEVIPMGEEAISILFGAKEWKC